ncbi:MAG: hypothetical protein J6X66_08870 [Lachnospiraceae bacterium]|nr:hypothetical protein [Lachnospiraceae bacterium]
MINTEKLLFYIVKSKCYVKDIAGQLGMSELGFIKCVGGIATFSAEQINTLCDVLHIPHNMIKEQNNG